MVKLKLEYNGENLYGYIKLLRTLTNQYGALEADGFSVPAEDATMLTLKYGEHLTVC